MSVDANTCYRPISVMGEGGGRDSDATPEKVLHPRMRVTERYTHTRVWLEQTVILYHTRRTASGILTRLSKVRPD